ncbi:protein RD3-like [Astatotilapia calliptera]|uniref:Protein RD3-like n=1 Tax=Astatotilapia calliptera TaxID=8154 RepID=A0AAX7V3M6_ASTCA|nr:protein RD3-like [Haplochromis burtoni]XP_026006820.1 protein RD3-like [Astatotilapia calliptera]
MPLFSWMKWSHETRVQAQDETPSLKISGGLPSRMLITELLWHVEERERLARELEREHRMAHSALGLHWFQKYPRLRTLIPSSELQQLEFLCAQIPSIQAATVLSRFREVLATNNIRPWELASVFKQILKDFLSQRGYDEEDDLSVQPVQFQPMEAWTSRYKMKQGFVTPTVPNCGDHPREEIPTVSGYVDRVMRHSGSFTAHRDWDLPYYYPVPLRSKGAYSTTL